MYFVTTMLTNVPKLGLLTSHMYVSMLALHLISSSTSSSSFLLHPSYLSVPFFSEVFCCFLLLLFIVLFSFCSSPFFFFFIGLSSSYRMFLEGSVPVVFCAACGRNAAAKFAVSRNAFRKILHFLF